MNETKLLLLLEVLVLYPVEVLITLEDLLLGFEEIFDYVEEFVLLLGQHLPVFLEEFKDLVVKSADDSVSLLDERMFVLALGHVVIDAADGEEAAVGEKVHQFYGLPFLQVQHPFCFDL